MNESNSLEHFLSDRNLISSLSSGVPQNCKFWDFNLILPFNLYSGDPWFCLSRNTVSPERCWWFSSVPPRKYRNRMSVSPWRISAKFFFQLLSTVYATITPRDNSDSTMNETTQNIAVSSSSYIDAYVRMISELWIGKNLRSGHGVIWDNVPKFSRRDGGKSQVSGYCFRAEIWTK